MKTGCSVTVIYEDEERRLEAVELCDRVVGRFWPGGELGLSWWSFEQLGAPDCVEEALSKASEADIVVFATGSETEFPLEVSHWIENWLARRGSREGMLIGLLGKSEPSRVAQKHLHLRKLAHRGGMDYLTGIPEYAARHSPESVEACQERAHRMTSVLDGILHQPAQPPHLVR